MSNWEREGICQKRDEGKMFYRIKDIERDRLGDRVRGDKRKERENLM